MRIGKESTQPYDMNEQSLDNVKEEKDGGVGVHNGLKFHTHASAAEGWRCCCA